MEDVRRIDISLLDDELKMLITKNLNIIPTSYDDILENINTLNSEYALSENNIYKWTGDSWEFVTSYSADILYKNILEKPSSFPPSFHNHSVGDIWNLSRIIDELRESDADISKFVDYKFYELDNHFNRLISNFISDVMSRISRKVDVKSGKELSSNDFTDELKAEIISNSTALDELKQFLLSLLSKKVENTTFYGHVDNKSMHLTGEERGKISSAKGKTYTHNQSQPSLEWHVNHNLNEFPSVTVVDSAGSYVICDVQYIDSDNLVIKHKYEFSGRAYLN